MLKNYLRSSLRSIVRKPLFSGVNVFGLSIGMACCLLLLVYISKELSYDKHFNEAKQIFRVTSELKNKGGLETEIATTSGALANGIISEIPGIQMATRLMTPPEVEKNLIQFQDKSFYKTNGYLADSTFFQVLNYEFLEGSAENALVEANSVVINKDLKVQLFGAENALNRVIEIDNGFKHSYKITGVIDDKRENSHLKISFLIPMHSNGWGGLAHRTRDSWIGNNIYYTYLKTDPGIDVAGIRENINQLLLRNGKEEMERWKVSKIHDLQPITDIHLYSNFDFIEISQKGNLQNIYIFSVVALVVLLVACINFVNLTTASATNRFGEVGVRKVLGSKKKWIISRFFVESALLVFISLIFSLVWLEVSLPHINQLTGQDLTINESNIFQFTGLAIGVLIFTTLLSGIYPSIYISSFQPAALIRSSGLGKRSKGNFRKYMVVIQFVISIALISIIGMINRQLEYVNTMDLGFNPHSKLVIPLQASQTRENYTNLKNEMESLPSVSKVAGTRAVPGSDIWDDRFFYKKGEDPENGLLTKLNFVDDDYIDLMEFKLLKGRGFSENYEKSDENELIINKTTMIGLGLSIENAIGQSLFFNMSDSTGEFIITGVIEDFHQFSVHQKIWPLAFCPGHTGSFSAAIIELEGQWNDQVRLDLEKSWNRINPEIPLEYDDLRDHFNVQYNDEKLTSSIITVFTVLALIISSLGLYGLSLYSIERRMKEIGVRKVLGASSLEIVTIIAREFGLLTLVAFVLAVPLSYYLMDLWLNNFAYRVEINMWLFVVSGAIAFIISQLVVGFETIKAARKNPVYTLRNE